MRVVVELLDGLVNSVYADGEVEVAVVDLTTDFVDPEDVVVTAEGQEFVGAIYRADQAHVSLEEVFNLLKENVVDG